MAELDNNFIQSIKFNLVNFFDTLKCYGYDKNTITEIAKINEKDSQPYTISYLKSLSKATKIKYDDLLCYDMLSSIMFPEECTVYFAAGKASKTGCTIFGKNSDKSGDASFKSDKYYMNRQINVVSYFENPNGSHIVGVSAAGSTGLKMGLNSYGVAAGTNYGQTKLAAIKKLDKEQKLAGDRAKVIRDALTEMTAQKAAEKAVAILMKNPTSSSGTVEFADASEAYIIESAYDYIAIKKVKDDVDSRANFFNVLSDLNVEGNVSSFCRYHRTQELLKASKGNITVDTLKMIATDHVNGPGANSICRHSIGYDSATLASAIMEIDGENPEKSKIHIALGTPCNAWNSMDGNITISMEMKKSDIPANFLNGDIFKKYCLAEPK